MLVGVLAVARGGGGGWASTRTDLGALVAAGAENGLAWRVSLDASAVAPPRLPKSFRKELNILT